MFAWVMPSNRVRVIHRSCRIVAESSTTRRDLLDILASMVHSQQAHETFNSSQLSICHRVELRADQRARCVSCQKLQELVIEKRQSLLVGQQSVNRDYTNHSILYLQGHTGTGSIPIRVFSKEWFACDRNHAFESFSQSDAFVIGRSRGVALPTRAHQVTVLIVNHI